MIIAWENVKTTTFCTYLLLIRALCSFVSHFHFFLCHCFRENVDRALDEWEYEGEILKEVLELEAESEEQHQKKLAEYNKQLEDWKLWRKKQVPTSHSAACLLRQPHIRIQAHVLIFNVCRKPSEERRKRKRKAKHRMTQKKKTKKNRIRMRLSQRIHLRKTPWNRRFQKGRTLTPWSGGWEKKPPGYVGNQERPFWSRSCLHQEASQATISVPGRHLQVTTIKSSWCQNICQMLYFGCP